MFKPGDRIEVIIPGKNYPCVSDFSCFQRCSYAEETYIGEFNALMMGDTGWVIDRGIYANRKVCLISLDRRGGTFVVGEEGLSLLEDELDEPIDPAEFERLF